MKARRLLVPVALLTTTFGIGLAQLMLPAPKAPPLANDDVSSLVTGEFSGNTHVDAVVLANGQPVLRESVETYQTYVSANLAATDIANLRGTGAGGRDQLVAVGPGGLTLLEILDVPVNDEYWSPTNLRPSNTYWAEAVCVRTGQVDGLYGDDIVAVTPSRVVIVKSNSSGGWDDVSFVAGKNLTSVELVDWDGLAGGALELAVLNGRNAYGPARIRIVRPNGTLLQTITSAADLIIASPLAAEGSGPRWLAAVSTDASTGAQDLGVVSAVGLAGPWSLGAAGVHDSVASDWNDDGIDDLVLGTNTARNAWLYRMCFAGSLLTIQSTETPPNSPIQLPVGHPNRNVAVQDGRMDVADIDHDGDVDLVTAVQGQYQATMWNYADSRFSTVDATLNGEIDQHDWMPWHAPGSSWPIGLPLPTLSLESGNLTVPLMTPNEVLDGVPQFEYAVWRTMSIESLAIPTPIFSGTEEIALPEDPGENELTYSTLTIPLDQHEPLFADRYTLIVRQVVRDGDDIVDESPALTVTFFSNLNAVEFLVDWNIETSDPLDHLPPDEPGGATAGPGLPPTPDDEDPSP